MLKRWDVRFMLLRALCGLCALLLEGLKRGRPVLVVRRVEGGAWGWWWEGLAGVRTEMPGVRGAGWC